MSIHGHINEEQAETKVLLDQKSRKGGDVHRCRVTRYTYGSIFTERTEITSLLAEVVYSQFAIHNCTLESINCKCFKIFHAFSGEGITGSRGRFVDGTGTCIEGGGMGPLALAGKSGDL